MRHRKSVSYDCEKLDELFRRLRRLGYKAKQDFSCCSGCAGYELAQEYGKAREAGKDWRGAVFYNSQDFEGLKESGEVYLAFGDISYWGEDDTNGPKYRSAFPTEVVGKEIVALCEELDIKYEWDGTASQRIFLDLRM